MTRPKPDIPTLNAQSLIEIDLAAAVVTLNQQAPQILVAHHALQDDQAPDLWSLPSGRFEPSQSRTLEIALRGFVSTQAGCELGYVEQLYTFGDRGRAAESEEGHRHVVSIGYLALTNPLSGQIAMPHTARFHPWYGFFPWEDWRAGRPSILDQDIMPPLVEWASDSQGERADSARRALSRAARLRLCFGADGSPWDEEKVLERYELLYEAGLLEEARRDGRQAALLRPRLPFLGEAMTHDHRRILATAMGRLRGKLKYRPVVFELMPEIFTLTDLQNTVEAISGRHLHKQNFRRFVENSALVEPTGQQSMTRGRPAQLFRFRPEVLQERPAPGLRLRGRH
jgi:hypothetical protein